MKGPKTGGPLGPLESWTAAHTSHYVNLALTVEGLIFGFPFPAVGRQRKLKSLFKCLITLINCLRSFSSSSSVFISGYFLLPGQHVVYLFFIRSLVYFILLTLCGIFVLNCFSSGYQSLEVVCIFLWDVGLF